MFLVIVILMVIYFLIAPWYEWWNRTRGVWNTVRTIYREEKAERYRFLETYGEEELRNIQVGIKQRLAGFRPPQKPQHSGDDSSPDAVSVAPAGAGVIRQPIGDELLEFRTRYTFVPHESEKKLKVPSDSLRGDFPTMSDEERAAWSRQNFAELESVKRHYEALVAGSLQRTANRFGIGNMEVPEALDAIKDLLRYEWLHKWLLFGNHETRAFRDQYEAHLRRSQVRHVHGSTAQMADPFVFDRKPPPQQRAPQVDIENPHDKDL